MPYLKKRKCVRLKKYMPLIGENENGKNWDEDDLRTPVVDEKFKSSSKNNQQLFLLQLRLNNIINDHSQDVFVPLIKIFSLSRNCIEKEKEDQPMLSEKISAHDVFYKNICLLYNIAFFLI